MELGAFWLSRDGVAVETDRKIQGLQDKSCLIRWTIQFLISSYDKDRPPVNGLR